MSKHVALNTKLSLHRETLRCLTDHQASGVEGAGWAATTGPGCAGHTVNAQSCVVVPDKKAQ